MLTSHSFKELFFFLYNKNGIGNKLFSAFFQFHSFKDLFR